MFFFSGFRRSLLCAALALSGCLAGWSSAYAMPSMDMSKVLKSSKDLPPSTKGRCLKEGTSAPDFTIETAGGKTFNLYQALETNNVLLTFYRGGWCPYCNFQLRIYERELKPIEAKNYQMVAISPDKVDAAINISPKKSFGFLVGADPKLQAIKGFNLAFKASPEVVHHLKTKGIDLNAQTGENHLSLPVPAVVIIGKDRKVKWCYANENYKIRPAVAVLQKKLAELK